MLIDRILYNTLRKHIGLNKVIILMGTRRVGKTILINSIQKEFKQDTLLLNAEDFDVQELLRNRSIANYQRVIGSASLLIIDEAQVIPDIGEVLKLMIDHFPQLTIIATGSSSFDLANKTGDPLTGRQIVYQLFPLAQQELAKTENLSETLAKLEERLILGSYPALFQMREMKEKIQYLQQLIQSYLFKDILAYEGIRQSDKITKLLRLLAYQCGKEVSFTELGRQLGMSKNTVETYMDLLSKVFIIYKVGAYSTNPRKEISKSSKWFFNDNGIRNALINDFRLPVLRNDMGMLWENYLMSERIKFNSYQQQDVQYYFWRTYHQQEIDLIELRNGQLSAIEFKYSPERKITLPVTFTKMYPAATVQVISRENYLDFITGE